MSKNRTLWRIISPQAIRVALPSLGNSFISLVKDTSLAYALTVTEAFAVAKQIAATNYEVILLYSEAALFYLIASTVLTWLEHKLEQSLFKHS